jgi:predicted transcriptional regulator of viral defense system
MSADASIADAVQASPHMVVALMSALRLHGLTTQLPPDLWVYIAHKARAPARAPVRLRIFRVAEASLSRGVETRMIDGVPVRVTTIARTLVDCFKRRADVGLDVAIEALRDAKRLKKVNMNDVWQAAEESRALTYMRPFLEAVA